MKRNDNPNNGNGKPASSYNNNGANKKAKGEDFAPTFEDELMMMDQYEYIDGIENTPEVQEARWSRPVADIDPKTQNLGNSNDILRVLYVSLFL